MTLSSLTSSKVTLGNQTSASYSVPHKVSRHRAPGHHCKRTHPRKTREFEPAPQGFKNASSYSYSRQHKLETTVRPFKLPKFFVPKLSEAQIDTSPLQFYRPPFNAPTLDIRVSDWPKPMPSQSDYGDLKQKLCALVAPLQVLDYHEFFLKQQKDPNARFSPHPLDEDPAKTKQEINSRFAALEMAISSAETFKPDEGTLSRIQESLRRNWPVIISLDHNRIPGGDHVALLIGVVQKPGEYTALILSDPGRRSGRTYLDAIEAFSNSRKRNKVEELENYVKYHQTPVFFKATDGDFHAGYFDSKGTPHFYGPEVEVIDPVKLRDYKEKHGHQYSEAPEKSTIRNHATHCEKVYLTQWHRCCGAGDHPYLIKSLRFVIDKNEQEPPRNRTNRKNLRAEQNPLFAAL